MKAFRSLLVFLLFSFFFAQSIHAAAAAPTALVMTMSGPISPANQEYLKRSIHAAEQAEAQVLILQLNTPGGDITSMTNMTIAM